MTNLSGRWTGSYAYPGSLSPVPFEAEVRDDGGKISGLTSESGVENVPQHASFAGQHDDHDIAFTKIYDSHDEWFEPIDYRGAIDADGCEISGTWSMMNDWSGPFVMVRPKPKRAEIEAEVAAKV